MDKELVNLLVAHGVCATQKEANSRVDKMSAATKNRHVESTQR